jgi:hypothetical protein
MPKTVEPMRSAGNSIVSLKVTLRGIKPPIWRRLLVPATMTLGDLHEAIQAAMGWDNDHLHAFDIAGRQYGDRDTVDDVADENRLTLRRAWSNPASPVSPTPTTSATTGNIPSPSKNARRRSR